MRITISISEELEKELREVAKREKRSVSAFVAAILQEYLEERKRRESGYRLLEVAGTVHVAPDIHEQLRKMRKEYDRL